MTKIIVSEDLVDYETAMVEMERLSLEAKEQNQTILWFLQHPSLYTAGSSAQEADLINATYFPIYKTGRGGRYTYHGPGQLILYCITSLHHLDLTVTAYVKLLEHWVLQVLKQFGIDGFLCPKRIGVWVKDPHSNQEEKIAALGIRISKGMTSHGLAFNFNLDLTAFDGIVPCGLHHYGVTSLAKLGIQSSFKDTLCAFQDTIPEILAKKWPI